MKKLITLLMVLLLIAGCSGKKDTESKPESPIPISFFYFDS